MRTSLAADLKHLRADAVKSVGEGAEVPKEGKSAVSIRLGKGIFKTTWGEDFCL